MADIEATALRDDGEDLYQENGYEMEAGFGNIIVVDNLPVVPPEKFEKLENVVRKIYSQIGVIKEGGLWMPVNQENQNTLGYCFIEYNTPQEAELAREKTNGYKLDESHILLGKIYSSEKARDQFVIPFSLRFSGMILGK